MERTGQELKGLDTGSKMYSLREIFEHEVSDSPVSGPSGRGGKERFLTTSSSLSMHVREMMAGNGSSAFSANAPSAFSLQTGAIQVIVDS